jgi:hypothetical protein
MAHDATITSMIGADLNFRCQYQASVMNTFDATSSASGAT